MLPSSSYRGRWERGKPSPISRGFFIFIFFISVFYKNIFSIWNFTEIYPGRPAAGRPGLGRPAAGRQGLIRKKTRKIIADRSLGPVARLRGGRPPLAARLPGGRLSHPYIRVGWSPHPSFASLQFQKPKKREGGREAKPYRIFEPSTAGNQNSSTLYK